MRALDIAIFMWILQASLFVVGSMYAGLISIMQPSPLITLEEIRAILVYDPNNTVDPVDVAAKMLTMLIVPVLMGFIAYQVMGMNLGQTTLLVVSIAIGLFFFGKVLFYIVSVGSLINKLITEMTGGLASLHSSVEWMLNSIGYIISFMGLMDWWRGTSTRYMG